MLKALSASRLKKSPFFLSHLVTTRCHCRCPMCLWRNQRNLEEMSSKEIGEFYRDSARHGFAQVAVWGGEPLMRDDLGEILLQARKAGLVTVLLTNGYYLEERLEEINPYLDAVILSLDYAGEEHDEIRGCPGLYQRVVAVLNTLRTHYPRIKVFLNYLLHQGNQEHIYPLAELALEHRASMFVCPVKIELSPGTPSFQAEQWKVDRGGEQLIGEKLKDLKRRGYPLNNSFTYIQEFFIEQQPYRCHFPKISLLIYPDGEVINCLDRHTPLGNVRRHSVGEIINTPYYQELKRQALYCNHCNNPNIVDSSFIWEFRREPMWNALRTLGKS